MYQGVNLAQIYVANLNYEMGLENAIVCCHTDQLSNV